LPFEWAKIPYVYVLSEFIFIWSFLKLGLFVKIECIWKYSIIGDRREAVDSVQRLAPDRKASELTSRVNSSVFSIGYPISNISYFVLSVRAEKVRLYN